MQYPDKWAEVGFVKGTPKVFVKLAHGYQKNIKVYKLELIDADMLLHYPKDGRHLISYVDGTTKGGKYIMEAHVRVVGGVAVAIELSVKYAHDQLSPRTGTDAASTGPRPAREPRSARLPSRW